MIDEDRTDDIHCVAYDLDEHGTLLVEARCATCGRFIKPGVVSFNGLGEIKFTDGWACSRCGETKPAFWMWED